MKFTIGLISILLVGCGKIQGVGTSSTVGELKSYLTTTPSSADVNNIRSICTAFNAKTSTLTTNTSLNFSFAEKDCAGVQVSGGDVEVVIQSSGSSYVFKNKYTSENFIFPEVETSASGLLAQFCQALSSTSTFQNPIISGSSSTYVTTTSISTADCAPVAGEICVMIDKGTLEGSMYRIHTKEVMRVRTSTNIGKTGYFTYRKKIARSYCAQDQAVTLEATLK